MTWLLVAPALIAAVAGGVLAFRSANRFRPADHVDRMRALWAPNKPLG